MCRRPVVSGTVDVKRLHRIDLLQRPNLAILRVADDPLGTPSRALSATRASDSGRLPNVGADKAAFDRQVPAGNISTAASSNREL